MSEAVAEPVATEADVAAAIAEQYGAAAIVKAASTVPPAELGKFDFDAAYQTKIAALALGDPGFMTQVSHLIKPDHFENAGEALIVNMALRYHEKFARLPDKLTVMQLIKDDLASNIIRQDMKPVLLAAVRKVFAAGLDDGAYAASKVAEFCRHQATGAAILRSVDLLGKRKFDEIEKLIQESTTIGVNVDGGEYDFWGTINQRTDVRLEKAAGKMPPSGITTGVTVMNDRLYHRGWGRKELSVIMGGAKAGKSMGLLNFAKYASLAGHHVLYVTLELSKEIAGDRLDAALTGTLMVEIGKNIHDIRGKIEQLAKKAGQLRIHEYPTGSLSPAQLHALIQRHKAKGWKYDLVVVDYADIMTPNYRTDSPIENSKSIWIDLRGIAAAENLAMLTATQTNRAGYMATVAKAEHVADDFNKIRTADLVISINSTEEERKRNEARLHFAASRNQEGDFTLLIRQNRAKMQFIEAVLGVE